jgi:hypothetical protein
MFTKFSIGSQNKFSLSENKFSPVNVLLLMLILSKVVTLLTTGEVSHHHLDLHGLAEHTTGVLTGETEAGRLREAEEALDPELATPSLAAPHLVAPSNLAIH